MNNVSAAMLCRAAREPRGEPFVCTPGYYAADTTRAAKGTPPAASRLPDDCTPVSQGASIVPMRSDYRK